MKRVLSSRDGNVGRDGFDDITHVRRIQYAARPNRSERDRSPWATQIKRCASKSRARSKLKNYVPADTERGNGYHAVSS